MSEVLHTWGSRLLGELFGRPVSEDVFVLDQHSDGLLPVIEHLSAQQASAVVPPETISIASHCGHILFLLNQYRLADQGQPLSTDWVGSWRYKTVSEAEWNDLRNELTTAYADVAARISSRDFWPDPPQIALTIILTHCSFHVGQVRQLLTFVQGA
jgi:hypothetical protein